jgi:endonuclease III
MGEVRTSNDRPVLRFGVGIAGKIANGWVLFVVTLAQVIRTLIRRHGAALKPVSRDPFALILYEQVAYLAPEARRRAAFRQLEREVGVTAEAIVSAPRRKLEAIARAGGAIAPELRATRMRTSAEMVIGTWDGDLRTALAQPLPKARATLAAFPMIGKPGADRILAITGAHAVFGLDSNALRVLCRIGWGKETTQYAATYRSVQEAVTRELPTKPAKLAEYSAVLQRHGQELCRRTAPKCSECAVVSLCRFGRSAAPANRPRA